MRSQILAMETLPSIDKIYNMVQQGEHHKHVMDDRDIKTKNMVVFAMSHLARSSAMQGERISCKHCRKIWHEEANYYELNTTTH